MALSSSSGVSLAILRRVRGGEQGEERYTKGSIKSFNYI